MAPSPWLNGFALLGVPDAVGLFDQWLAIRVDRPVFLAALSGATLVCDCGARPCHGDVLLKWVAYDAGVPPNTDVAPVGPACAVIVDPMPNVPATMEAAALVAFVRALPCACVWDCVAVGRDLTG